MPHAYSAPVVSHDPTRFLQEALTGLPVTVRAFKGLGTSMLPEVSG